MSNVRPLDPPARAEVRSMLDRSLAAVGASKRTVAARLDRQVRNHLAEIAAGHERAALDTRVVLVPLGVCRKALMAQRLHDIADAEGE